MHRLTDGGLDGLGGLGGTQIDDDSAWMLVLQVRLINSPAKCGAQIAVPDIANYANNGDIEFDIACALRKGVANSVLRRAEKSLCEGKIDDGDIGLPFRISRSEFSANKERLMERREITGGDRGLLEAHILIFCGLVALYREIGCGVVSHEFRVGRSSHRRCSWDSLESLDGAGDDLRCAVFAVTCAAWFETEANEI